VLRVVSGPKRGYIDVRHRILPTLRGRLVVSLNDDVVPAPDFLAVHRRAHEELAAAGRRAVIVGDSRFAPVPEPTLLDEALDRTGIVFFWHTMDDDDPDRDWGWRHCFGLNFSVRREELEAAGGMPSVPETYGYDDIELGWRLVRRGLPVLHRPAAVAPHEHRYRAGSLLTREFRLGEAAVRYARVNPAFAMDLFGRDILAAEERAWARRFLVREAADLRRRRERFLGFDAVPADGIGAAMLPLACELVADHARPLRQACWCEGMLSESGEPPEAEAMITPGIAGPAVDAGAAATTRAAGR
jgi:GT2 family glycosyltransferase